MKLLTAFILISCITACNASKAVIKNNAETNTGALFVISVNIETSNSETNVNDVLNACNYVKLIRSFSLNYLSAGRMELKLVYEHITNEQKEHLFNRLSTLSGVKVMKYL